MNRIYIVSAMLIMGNLVLGGVIVGDAVATEQQKSDVQEVVSVSTDRVTAFFTEDSAEVEVDGPNADASVEVGEGTDNSAEVSAQGIDEGVEDSASIGLCAVGLDSDESPIDPEVDGEDSSFSVGFDTDYEGNPDMDDKSMTPDSVLDRCGVNGD